MDLPYQILFILNFLVCFLLMKATSWFVTPPHKRPAFLTFAFGSPYLSPRSLRIASPPPRASHLVMFLLYGAITFAIVKGVAVYLSPISYADRILLGVAVYFLTETIGSLGQTLFFWRKENTYSIHFRPLTSPSLSQFWGRRWNLWVQEWITDVARPFHRKHKQKLIASFFFSGLFHEAMINFPHWAYTGESYFGTMLAYFLIQGAGLYVDKKYLRSAEPLVRRVFCWLVIMLPSPLFIHVPLLKFFGMTE